MELLYTDLSGVSAYTVQDSIVLNWRHEGFTEASRERRDRDARPWSNRLWTNTFTKYFGGNLFLSINGLLVKKCLYLCIFS